MRVICEEIDGWPQELSRKKKFWKNSRKKVVLEWEKEIAIMHMYPIQTVGSSCPTFSTSAAKKTQCFHIFTTFLYLVPHFCQNLVRKAIQKYLYKGCNFYPLLSECTEIKVSSCTEGHWVIEICISQISIQIFRQNLFQFFIINPPLLFLIRVLNIQSGNHFVWRKFEYKTCRINIF